MARVLSRIFWHQILDDNSPLTNFHFAHTAANCFAILCPRYVWRWIAFGWTLQTDHVAGWFRGQPMEIVQFDKSGRSIGFVNVGVAFNLLATGSITRSLL